MNEKRKLTNKDFAEMKDWIKGNYCACTKSVDLWRQCCGYDKNPLDYLWEYCQGKGRAYPPFKDFPANEQEFILDKYVELCVTNSRSL